MTDGSISAALIDDGLTVAAPIMEGTEAPTTDEVTLADLDLRTGQRFLYVFDFGDNLHHEIEILDVFPAPAHGKFPRLVESHGAAPPQYPQWQEEVDADAQA